MKKVNEFYNDNKETIAVAVGTALGTMAASWLVKKAAKKICSLAECEDDFEDPFDESPMHEVGDDPDEDLSDLLEDDDSDEDSSESSESSNSESAE